jgi:GDP-L-fucose synthase
MNSDMKVLVAGASGLVGSAVVRQLHENGYWNTLTPSHSELDLLDADATMEYVREHGPELTICCAAKVGGIGGNSRDNYGFLNQNLLISQNLISSCFGCGVPNFVFLGSSCIYPKFAHQPIKESELLSGPLEPTNEGYALAKITGIKLCEFLRRQHGVRYYSLMPCNLYGIGDNYNIETGHVLPTLIAKFVNAKESGASSVVLWGDGSPLREFLFADDLAAGVVASLDISDSDLPDLMNIGSGEEISILELANVVKDIVGYSGDIVWDRSKPNGTPRKVMDSTLFRSLAKWRPHTSLVNGIRQCVNDYLRNRNSLRGS